MADYSTEELEKIADKFRSDTSGIRGTKDFTSPEELYEELKKEIQQYVKKNTAPYKYPRIVEFVDELPKTISGKIKRNELRNR